MTTPSDKGVELPDLHVMHVEFLTAIKAKEEGKPYYGDFLCTDNQCCCKEWRHESGWSCYFDEGGQVVFLSPMQGFGDLQLCDAFLDPHAFHSKEKGTVQ